jgi:LPS-assembly protein
MFRLASHRYYFLPLLMSLAQVTFAQFKTSSALGDSMSPSVRKQTPTFIFGDVMTSRPDLDMVVDGNAEIRKTDTVIRAKRIEYNQVSDVAKLSGDVLVNQGGNRFWGPYLELGLSDFSGFFSQPSYKFYKTGGQGSAKQLEFVNQRSAIAKFASYSTCKRPDATDGKPWKPDWILNADQIDFNMEEDIAIASGTTLRFKDVPILAVPSVSFPMSGARKSGLLSPSFVSDSQSGFIVTQPVYWNIAPNRDATFYPSTIGRRGINYGGEFRYLEPNSTGTMRADYLPNDKLVGSNRWAYAVDQRNLIRAPFQGSSDVLMTLKLNRVGDDQYWRDLPNSTSSLTQRLLNNELNTTANLSGWATQVRIQRWQTLQDKTSTIAPPFDRSQLFTRRSFNAPSGLNFQLEGDMTEFRSRPDLTSQPNGTRAYGLAQMARPWIQPWGYITPKLQMHATTYYTDNAAVGVDTSSQRTVPTFSLDGGLFFEREMALFGRGFTQTLEPRAFYVRTPYRNQSGLPNYDSGVKDFSLATIYSENSFVGNDRISDMNMLTLGLNSKFLNPNTGAQAFSAGVAQRFSYIDQQVTLPNTTAPTTRLSDYLVNTSVRLYPAWSVDGTVQVGANSGTSERATLSTRYTPSNYRSFYAAYRMQQGVSEQVDVSWQWPLGDLFRREDENVGGDSMGRGLGANRWYSVTRLNYSVFDKRLVNAIAGFEYDADCWIGRIVLEKMQLDAATSNQRIMFQIEFTGFSRLGTSPLASLRSNIPRYQNLREQITSPSRYSQYD